MLRFACRHCVSTISPPGLGGVNLPHVAGAADGSSLPPGEHCYQCGTAQGFDKDSEGVALRKRTQRRRRDTLNLMSNFTALPVSKVCGVVGLSVEPRIRM